MEAHGGDERDAGGDTGGERLANVARRQDARLARLFRRWPRLDRTELTELRTLYRDRMRVARELGRRRSGR